jgi:hypothetical protein
MSDDAPYPFPGLNPYFEPRWFEVHPSMIVYARNQMQRQMPHGLHVSIEHGMTISGRPPLDDDNRQPDVSVWKVREDTLLANAPVNYAPPVCVEVAIPKPRHLTIRETHDGQLVTVIEFISPSNKHGGGAIAYGQKRQSVINAGLNLVEVDLIRKWGLALAQFEDDRVTETLRTEDGHMPSHAVTVVRAVQPHQREVYPVCYTKALPACQRRGVRWQRCKGSLASATPLSKRGKNALRPKHAVRQTTAVSRCRLPPHSTTLARDLNEFEKIAAQNLKAGLSTVQRDDVRGVIAGAIAFACECKLGAHRGGFLAVPIISILFPEYYEKQDRKP